MGTGSRASRGCYRGTLRDLGHLARNNNWRKPWRERTPEAQGVRVASWWLLDGLDAHPVEEPAWNPSHTCTIYPHSREFPTSGCQASAGGCCPLRISLLERWDVNGKEGNSVMWGRKCSGKLYCIFFRTKTLHIWSYINSAAIGYLNTRNP